MQKEEISLTHANGTLDGIYMNAGKNTPLVIIANGHNGFYNYGMFPYIQENLYKSDMSSYSFNYSHGGVIEDTDYFDDLQKYEKNCMRLEKEDILCALQSYNTGKFGLHGKVFILTHSLGGAPTVFATEKAEQLQLKIDGIILICSVKTLRFWPSAMIDEWKEKGVYYKRNNRTQQDLPQGKEFLSEILASNDLWNIEATVKRIKVPILIVHGEKDEAVPLEHGEALFSWCKNNNPKNGIVIVANATHTFNTKHPFVGPTDELEEMLKVCKSWIYKT